MEVIECRSPAEMSRACAIKFDAMGRDHVFVDECFPSHWTLAGRRAAAQRFCAPEFLFGDESMKHLKIVDTLQQQNSQPIPGVSGVESWIGYGRWQIKRPKQEAPRSSYDIVGEWWSDERDREFCDWLAKAYHVPRKLKFEETGYDKGLFCVDVLAVQPGRQGSGAGDAFIEWGIKQADELGCQCTVESALRSEKFYARHGFKPVEHVRLTPPEEFSDKGTQEYIFMVRPGKDK